MQGCYKMDNQSVLDFYFFLMKIFTMENSRMVLNMAKDAYSIKMVLNILGNFSLIEKMDKD